LQTCISKDAFLKHEIHLDSVKIFVQNLKNGLIKLAKGAPMSLVFNFVVQIFMATR